MVLSVCESPKVSSDKETRTDGTTPYIFVHDFGDVKIRISAQDRLAPRDGVIFDGVGNDPTQARRKVFRGRMMFPMVQQDSDGSKETRIVIRDDA